MERLTSKKMFDQIKKKVNLENVNISYMDFSGADLTYTSFLNTNLRVADFEAAKIDCTNFDNADMEGANFNDHNF